MRALEYLRGLKGTPGKPGGCGGAPALLFDFVLFLKTFGENSIQVCPELPQTHSHHLEEEESSSASERYSFEEKEHI